MTGFAKPTYAVFNDILIKNNNDNDIDNDIYNLSRSDTRTVRSQDSEPGHHSDSVSFHSSSIYKEVEPLVCKDKGISKLEFVLKKSFPLFQWNGKLFFDIF